MLCKSLLNNTNAKNIFSKKVLEPPQGYQKFIVGIKSCENELIDLRTIIGSTKRHKYEDTWYNTLLYLKRRKSNFDNYSCDNILEFYTNPNYMGTQRSYGWHIIFINKKGFISEGHHRTTIAKFLSTLGFINHYITIPNVTYYDVDLKSLKKFNSLNRKLKTLKKIFGEEFNCSIEAQNDNCKITYFLNITMPEINILEPIRNERYNSIDNLQIRLFKYLKNYSIKKRERKKKEKITAIIFFISLITGLIILNFL